MSNLALKSKKGTVIHRTTSETLRLGDDILNNHNPCRVQTNNSRKKSQTTSPSCSFQITGVSLTRYDVGDDSADDLDESHTDDISRVTDNETPSFSEDSRENDDQPQHIVYTTTTANISAPKIDTEIKRKETQAEDVGLGRFKVVKIESVVPFSRGRWTCFDYLDQSENTSKGSYVFCKSLESNLSEIMDSSKSRTCNASSLKDSNYIEFEDKQMMIPNTSAFWDTNCQEPYLYSGAIIMPDTTALFAEPLGRSLKNKIRSTYPPPPPNMISVVRPIRPSRPFFTTAFDSFSKHSTIDKNNLLNTCSAKNRVEVGKSQDARKETAMGDTNKPVGASVSCTATIDTKIEHALDVVKNHLTHAVRLEVEELKIKIDELVDRISYLEYENDILRANVAPDVLANLGNSGRK